MPPEYVLRARNNFCAWLRWYIASYPEIAPTSAALARKMGVTKGGLQKFLEPSSQRIPDLKTMLAAERLLGWPLHALLHSTPPEALSR